MTTKACQTLVVVACLLCGGVAHAQVARSQFNGTVTDTAGGVLVGVTVIATNVETNVESKATTTDAGVYVIPVPPERHLPDSGRGPRVPAGRRPSRSRFAPRRR